MPVPDSELHPAGTALPFGFHVPPGTVQVGATLPCATENPFRDSYCPASGDSASVMLAIDGAPDAAANAVLAEARRLGLHGGVRCSTRFGVFSCSGEAHDGPDAAHVPIPLKPLTPSGRKRTGPRPTMAVLPRHPGRGVWIELRYGHAPASFANPAGPIAVMTLDFEPKRTALGCDQYACARTSEKPQVSRPRFGAAPNAGDVLDPIIGSNVKVLAGSRVVFRVYGDAAPRGNALTLLTADDPVGTALRYVAAIRHAPYIDEVIDQGAFRASGWTGHAWTFSGGEAPYVRVVRLHRGAASYIAIETRAYA